MNIAEYRYSRAEREKKFWKASGNRWIRFCDLQDTHLHRIARKFILRAEQYATAKGLPAPAFSNEKVEYLKENHPKFLMVVEELKTRGIHQTVKGCKIW
tara:strand:+ start:75 stop:371 length:297 start_codon:yes stop_codon:yes gene_type:complete